MPAMSQTITRVPSAESQRIAAAWAGRVSGCILGKPVEVLSFREGLPGLQAYLRAAGALPLRDYIPALPGTLVEELGEPCCRGRIHRAEPDDDINYTLIALHLLETVGTDFETADVARVWLQRLPAGQTWTAERAAYRTLLECMADEFVNGAAPGFDLSRCSDNPYNEWIGAQIRTDLYGWVCPGRPDLAAEMARRDASLSHRGEGIHAAVFIAALGAALPDSADLDKALDAALVTIPADCDSAAAVAFGRSLANASDAVAQLHEKYRATPPVHAVNNLALVIWALCAARGDFSAAIGNAVAAGWDTDCNGATVGGLCGLMGYDIPRHWTDPWQGRIMSGLAGQDECRLDDLVERTVSVARQAGA